MIPSCFYAYPDIPSSLGETIEIAIKKINNTGSLVQMKSWQTLSATGNYIITEICNEIKKCNLFVCDLTQLNFNVLFELGFAIAQNKKVWITLDPNIESAKKNYEKFRLLSTIGYSVYNNSNDIAKSFHEEKPYDDLRNTIYINSIKSIIANYDKQKGFYLKSKIDTESSIVLSNRIKESILDVTIDDPAEITTQTLSWYVQNTNSAIAVVSHLISENHLDSNIINARYSLISGLAYGFGKPLLMLAHAPFSPPIDYMDILRTHSTAKECLGYAHDWLIRIEIEYLGTKKSYYEGNKKIKLKNKLQGLYIGDYMAESESDDLIGYFIETSIYNQALNAKHSIIVGRKGTGKTANLYKISHELGQDHRNHVCLIKPVSYELEGILYLFSQSMQLSEKGYLAESIWKYLIYTEIGKSLYERILSRPSYANRTSEEQELCQFVQNNSDIITPDFSVRLQNAVIDLCGIREREYFEEHRTKVSELLHFGMISRLRVIMSKVLAHMNRVTVIMDNIDKAWVKRKDIDVLRNLIFGLLSVSRRVVEEFNKGDNKIKLKVNLSMIIFIRSDIFEYVIGFASERDKISYTKISWNNEMLLRIVEERFFHAAGAKDEPINIWKKYFCETVSGMPTKDYLISMIIPRPRDIVYLCKEALFQAINNGHQIIEENDILSAVKNYSEYVFDSITVENGVTTDEMESILYEFAGSKHILNENQIVNVIEKTGLEENKVRAAIEHLLDVTFLGVEVDNNKFEYFYDDRDRKVIEVLARKYSENKERRYCINNPFHSYLSIVN